MARMNWTKIKSGDQMRSHGSESMGGEIPHDLWSLSEPYRRGRPNLKAQLAARMKLSLEEQIALGLVEPIDPDKMIRRVGRKRPG